MTYILSNLEGDNINEKLEVIVNENKVLCNELIIIGNIIETSKKNNHNKMQHMMSNALAALVKSSEITTSVIEEPTILHKLGNISFLSDSLRVTKLNNLANIHYCLINNTVNVKLLLGNEDLKIYFIYKYLEIDRDDNNLPGDSIDNFNNGNIEISSNKLDEFTNYNKQIKWKYTLDDFYNNWTSAHKNIYNNNIVKNHDTPFKTSIYNRFLYLFKFTLNAEFLLYSIPNEINNNNDSEQNIKEIDHYRWINSFIVLSIFRSLLAPKVYNPTTQNMPEFTTNSNFCNGWLYSLYLKDSTSIILLYNDKYLLSNYTKITECIDFFSNKEQVTGTDSLEYLKNTILLCNFAFKHMIQENYNNTNINININNFFNKFFLENPASLIDKLNQHYTSPYHKIIQIFGYNTFDIPNLFYKINDLNILVYLTTLNYIYINEDTNILNSVSKRPILLPENRQYNDIIAYDNTLSTHLIYITKEYYSEYKKELPISILNNVDSNSLIYLKYKFEFNILNTYITKYDSLIKLIYNGFIVDNDKIFFMFFIIKNKIIIYYILSKDDISNLLQNNLLHNNTDLHEEYLVRNKEEKINLDRIRIELLKQIKYQQTQQEILNTQDANITSAKNDASNINTYKDTDEYEFIIQKINHPIDCDSEKSKSTPNCININEIDILITDIYKKAGIYLAYEDMFLISRKNLAECIKFVYNEDDYNNTCHNNDSRRCTELKTIIETTKLACIREQEKLYTDTLIDRLDKAQTFNEIFKNYKTRLSEYNRTMKDSNQIISMKEFEENLKKFDTAESLTSEDFSKLDTKDKQLITAVRTQNWYDLNLHTMPNLMTNMNDMKDISFDKTLDLPKQILVPLDLTNLVNSSLQQKLKALEDSYISQAYTQKYLKYKYKYLKLNKK